MKAKRFVQPVVAGLALVVAWTAAPVSPAAGQQTHELKPSPNTVHIGHFSAAIRPVLTINSGDIVVIEGATHIDPALVERSGVVPPGDIPECQRAIYREVKDRGPSVHILTGPVYANGAEAGDVLEVRILDVELAVNYAFNTQLPYRGTLPDEFTQFWQRIIRIDRQNKTRASPCHGPDQQRAPGDTFREHGQQGPRRGGHPLHAGPCPGCPVLCRRPACGPGAWGGGSSWDSTRILRRP